ncbi:MAG TPA: hybrid sensor histidine kinase/response regulator [Nitrospirota bacterium]|nr:hybrid sensor histidine kinase/response regulator [Nitrospirota bacterium]
MKQILIVEDEHDCAELLRYNLQKENYQTIIARSGEEAINAVQRHTPDAVLLDIMLPELNGWEVCRILRESANNKYLPIIMLTALSDEEARVKGLSLGADDYISKPYSMKELLLKVRKLIDREQAIHQLRTLEQEQDTALRYMVHELKNSLSTIGGFSSLALRKDDTNKHLKTINAAASHAESLLNDASLLSRLEKGSSMPLEEIDIDQIVADAVDFSHDAARQSNIEIITANGATSTVRGNKTAVRQVMINLISNAVKYNRMNGKVWVSSADRSGCVDISVQDEGSGIQHADLARIFEKFYRAAGSERRKGAGLGLYIVKRLIEAMGGKIAVASQLGKGSIFTASFPKADAAMTVLARDVA